MLKHARERDLVALAMGFAGAARRLRRHLAACEECGARLAELRSDLARFGPGETPELDRDFERRVLARVQAKLDAAEAGRVRAARAPVLAWAAGVAAVLALAAGLGWSARIGRGVGSAPAEARESAGLGPVSGGQVGARVLRTAAAQQLDRSQMLLVALEHAREGARGPVDLSLERQWARELLESDRLMRTDAAAAGQTRLTQVLDALEPILVQIAHTPAKVSVAQCRELEGRIAASGILFQIRIADQDLDRADAPQALEDGTL